MLPVMHCKATLNQHLNSIIKSGFQQVDSTILWQHNCEGRKYSLIKVTINCAKGFWDSEFIVLIFRKP